MQGKRSRIDIIFDMLQTIQKKGGRIKPTHLMYKANLSHNQMKQYLEELISKSMVEEEPRRGKASSAKDAARPLEAKERKMLILTDKGLAFINQFNQMKEMEKTFGL